MNDTRKGNENILSEKEQKNERIVKAREGKKLAGWLVTQCMRIMNTEQIE